MSEIAAVEGAHLRGFKCDDGEGIAGQSHEFHFVSNSVVVNMHYGPNIPRLKTLIRSVRRQHYAIVFFDRHLQPKGYALISRGATAPLSICQTVRTSGRRPLGVFNLPSTTKRGPKPVSRTPVTS